MPKKQQQQEQVVVKQEAPQQQAPKPKQKRTKGWQFDVDTTGQDDPLTVFRSVAADPDIQYLAHTVDPGSGAIKGVVRFSKPKSSKAFESGVWQSVNARGAPMRVTSSTATTQLGHRVWAFGSLSGKRSGAKDRPVEDEGLEPDDDEYDDEEEE
jgi:hypothetical protein